MVRLQRAVSKNRKRILPGLVALSLLAGLIVSIVVAPNAARADYAVGCGYGYNSSAAGFGYGTGTGYGYGYVNGTNFGYGYGNQVCPISITTSSLPGGTVGTPYSGATFTGTGGTNTFTWSESGSFPNGLTLSSAGSITGTPTVSGSFAFTVTMTDGNGQSTSGSFSIAIAAASGGGGGGGGGGTTTTTSTSTTTTTAPTTTTTTAGPPPPPRKACWFHAIKFHGFAVVGRTMTRAITGACFYGQPIVTSNEVGTTVGVLHDNGRVLVVRVTVPSGSKPGWHTFTILEPNGKSCKVNYLVRIILR